MAETQHVNEEKLGSVSEFLGLWENYHEIYAELVSDYEELVKRVSKCSGNSAIRKPKLLGNEEYKPSWAGFLLIPNFDQVCSYFFSSVGYRKIWSLHEVVFEENILFLLRNLSTKCGELRRFWDRKDYDPERLAYAMPPEYCTCGRHYGHVEGAYPSDE